MDIPGKIAGCPKNGAGRIRKAETGDGKSLHEIAQLAFAPYLERMDRPPAPMLADYGELIAKGDAWILELDGRIAAFAILKDEEDGWLLLDIVAVNPAFQKRGLGRQLVNFAMETAKDRCQKGARLYTNAAMIENLEWYPKLGFREIGRKRENGYDRVWFEQEIGDQAHRPAGRLPETN